MEHTNLVKYFINLHSTTDEKKLNWFFYKSTRLASKRLKFPTPLRND